ncbi:TolC family outer membrane protein [Ferribacterium limneticum]|uniref:TolC family outer membrane protein n=1 Tax=Ferribacterium limneticum TaxID=76259 RepID=UPI001CF941BF|nr:TolC family outer membrane protein [Ferribacterium limneticum]UCV27714.1 TolC family outer membrane protein [Ferribacterium limneticum]UCV31631.1 TolC family outer membrane protein [Ferribacterium limneticum]
MKSNAVASLLLAVAIPAIAQVPSTPTPAQTTLKDVAQSAVLNSPEVTSKWHNYKAADEEIGVARGGYFPRVDLTAGSGRESLRQPSAAERDYTRSGYMLSLNQMLFDGFATRNEVRRLDKAKLVRYYELLDASENVALEAGRAYLDVLRYRHLVDLAKDNYVQHKATYDQIQRRTQSGVGRRVDFEQAGSRLALAEINLVTESANLHDVTARFQRLVGAQPEAAIVAPTLVGSAFPEQAKVALDTLHKKNPALLAATENIEAAQYEINTRRAAYSPKLDFRARTDQTKNYLGDTGQRDYKVAELVVSWNLFNGGSDRAREKQTIEKKNLAFDLREKACRDTRQTLLIAYNDVLRLKEQSLHHARQVALLEKTRNAYRDQFNIGQRTLLDLLDTENELLSARRSAANADTDLSLAYLRTYAGMGTLLEYLGLQRLDAETPNSKDLAEIDPSQLCPNDPIALSVPDREALNAKAAALNAAQPMPVPVAVEGEAAIQDQVKSWAAAWSARDYSAYSGFYAPTFTPDGGLSREDWAQLRRSRIATRGEISVEIQDLKVRLDGNDRAFAEFRQVYQSNSYRDTTQKTLELIRVGGKWLINRESSVPCTGNTVGGCKGLGK